MRGLLGGQKAGHACNFGFIEPSGGSADAFANNSAIQRFGIMSVEEGHSAEDKVESGPDCPHATNIQFFKRAR
ncbi:cold shock domain-containing protein [Glutamicibacter nicotianae]|uniref:cold shock domain-containing protein n=1 Tax=Glutamicibacter nicotianae TaxID=37929 RepID=UPI0025558585|nr:cold shock domain-containing protein [Glutamicibacter nicotianae]WIV43758.1 cold shock domain-containing protein [Glutamicibacter nicotianae]